MRRWARRSGVMLGLLALAVSLYLPIHLAGDVVHAAMHALAHARAAEAKLAGIASSVPAHHDHGGGTPHRHGDACPICVSVSAAALATLLPTPPPLAPPALAAAAMGALPPAALDRTNPRPPYAPRAPPVRS